jgi:hypothetical protein
MHDNVSSGIFRCGSWTNSIDVSKDSRAEIVSIKMRAFWKHSDKRKTEWGPENGKHSLGLLIICLARVEITAPSGTQGWSELFLKSNHNSSPVRI